MWTTGISSISYFCVGIIISVTLLFNFELLTHPFHSAHALCDLKVLHLVDFKYVNESEPEGSYIELPHLERVRHRYDGTNYSAAIKPEQTAHAAACAQFRATIELTNDSLIPRVQVARPLDFDLHEMFACVGKLAIYSTLNDTPISCQDIGIALVDVNDNPPLFTQQTFDYSVSENEYPLASFALPVSDGDTKPNAQFNASIQNVSCFRASRPIALNENYCRTRFDQLFRVEVHTVASIDESFSLNISEPQVCIVATNFLDYEDVSFWRFVVRVSDDKVIAANTDQDEAAVTIDVRDRPEPPELVGCDENLSLAVPENAVEPHIICLLEVLDPDVLSSEPQPMINCTIEPHDRFELVFVGSSEKMRYRIQKVRGRPLDREVDAQMSLLIRCSDPKATELVSQLHAKVQVIDINDNPPHFISPGHSANETLDIPCDQVIGKLLYTFHADDADSVSTSITYTLLNATVFIVSRNGSSLAAASNESSDFFRVNSTSGELSLMRQLQCLDFDRMISLTIRASDGELDGTARFSIAVRRKTTPFAAEETDSVFRVRSFGLSAFSRVYSVSLWWRLLLFLFSFILIDALVEGH